MNKFIARYNENGKQKSFAFDKSVFDEQKARIWLESKGIKNFFFYFEPWEPSNISETQVLFRGDVGFDITFERLLPHLSANKEIIFDSFGGDLWEAWKIYDGFKLLKKEPSLGILGSCASATTLIIMSSRNNWISENSRFLIHNPWSWEAGDDEVMTKAATLLAAEKNKLAQFYSTYTGKPVDEILSLMKEEKFITASETVAMGFVKEIKKESDKLTLINNDMTKEEFDSGIDGLFNKIANFFKPAIKNIIIQDVNGVELDFEEGVESIDDVVVGTTATVDGNPADGDFTFSNGKTYTFEGGAVTAISEPAEEEDTEALKAENEQLKERVSQLEQELQNKLSTAKADYEKNLKALKKEINDFKNKFSNSTPTPPASPGGDDGEEKIFKATFKRK